jgi:single-stranded-DNA-specific exonuclease
MEASVDSFIKSCESAAHEISNYIKRGSTIKIFAHDDADGVTAGSIMAKAIHRLGGHFHLRIVDRISEKLIEQLSETKSDIYVFAEIGSGYIDLLKPLSPSKVVVLDHHKPVETNFSNLTHVNPHHYGIDGATEVSGSSVCYLTARGMSCENRDLAYLAVVGALADLQDKNEGRRLVAVNSLVVKDAEQEGFLEVTKDLLFYGRETRPIHRALASTVEPFIPSLTGEEDKCLGFLVNLGIPLKVDDRWRTIADLKSEEKQAIFSKITIYLSSQGISGASILQLVGNVYTLVKEDRLTPLRDGREFGSLLNACTRMDQPSVAVSICLGERGDLLAEAQGIFDEYRKTIARCIGEVLKDQSRIVELENIYTVRCSGVVDEKLLSPIASILSSSGAIGSSKPLIVLTETKAGESKVSARGTAKLVEAGLNLGEIMKQATEKFGGRGGGHNIAAGATFPLEHEKEFISFVNQMVKER